MDDITMVEAVTIEYRDHLGFEPFAVYAAIRRGMYPDPDRATGRSTRGVVRALAQCSVLGFRVLVMFASWVEIQQARELSKQLRLHLDITPGSEDRIRGLPGILVHRDHYYLEKRFHRMG